MKADIFRDESGFWHARIEEDEGAPENRGVGAVYRRRLLPVPPSASYEEAREALRRIMSREARCRHGRR